MQREPSEYVVVNGHVQRLRHRHSPKNYDEMSVLRRLTSLSYLKRKARGWWFARREPRETLFEFGEFDMARPDSYPTSEETFCGEDPRCTFPLANDLDKDDRRSSIVTMRTSVASSDCDTYYSQSMLNEDCAAADPITEQRWCHNCNKCFQRQLSHFDDFCGLDCKTAFRMRLL